MPDLSRLVFFGTPELALPSLQALVEAGRAPLLVVTPPDRPAGRGQRLRQPPVAQWAQGRELPLRQVDRVRDEAFLAELRSLDPDLAVVVAFGRIFPKELLELPRHGCVNVHTSLLPRHRGAAPIQAALRCGDAKTGVSIMQMDEGLDTGPILLQLSTLLSGHETAGELAPRLAHLGAAALLETLSRWEAGGLTAIPQPDAGVTHAPRLRREDGWAHWGLPASTLYDLYRAVTPWPGLHTELRGKPLHVLRAVSLSLQAAGEPPGAYLGLVEGSLAVSCGDGAVLGLACLQRPGRRPVTGRDLANGERLQRGERFGVPDGSEAGGA
jgi:methionyl-tRNA formyltransferase